MKHMYGLYTNNHDTLIAASFRSILTNERYVRVSCLLPPMFVDTSYNSICVYRVYFLWCLLTKVIKASACIVFTSSGVCWHRLKQHKRVSCLLPLMFVDTSYNSICVYRVYFLWCLLTQVITASSCIVFTSADVCWDRLKQHKRVSCLLPLLFVDTSYNIICVYRVYFLWCLLTQVIKASACIVFTSSNVCWHKL